MFVALIASRLATPQSNADVILETKKPRASNASKVRNAEVITATNVTFNPFDTRNLSRWTFVRIPNKFSALTKKHTICTTIKHEFYINIIYSDPNDFEDDASGNMKTSKSVDENKK